MTARRHDATNRSVCFSWRLGVAVSIVVMSYPVLVTGGAGYIGSHACKALAQAGYLPVAYDNLSRGHADLVKWGPLVQGDVNDGVRLASVFEKYKPSAVMHFAALAYVGESVNVPAMT